MPPGHGSDGPRRALPYLLAALTVVFWSGNYVLARSVIETFPPVALAFWRWLLAWAILLPFAWPAMRRSWPVIRAHWLRLAVLGVLGVPGYNTMVYVAFHTTTTINASVLNSTMPLAIAVMAWALFGERLSRIQSLGVLVSLIGVLWIVGRGDPAAIATLDVTIGDLWVIGAVLVYSLYTVLLRLRPKELGAIAFLGVTVTIGILALLPVFLVELAIVGAPQVTAENAASVLYMAVFASLLAYIFWNYATATIGATRTGMFIHLVPVLTTIMALVFLDEKLGWYHVVGLGAVFAGVLLVARGGRRAVPPAATAP